MAIVQDKVTASKSGQSAVDPKAMAAGAVVGGGRPPGMSAPSPVPQVPTLGGSEDPASGFFGSFFNKKKKGGPLEGVSWIAGRLFLARCLFSVRYR